MPKLPNSSRSPWIVVLAGLLLAVVAFSGYYLARTAPQRAMLKENTPELAWLKEEFNLSDAEFQRVSELHEAYLPKCAEMCQLIAAQQGELRELLRDADAFTPEIEAKMDEANRLRMQCHKNMLEHFFAVSKAMPPEQGKRYLAWVQETTILRDAGGMASSHEHHE